MLRHVQRSVAVRMSGLLLLAVSIGGCASPGKSMSLQDRLGQVWPGSTGPTEIEALFGQPDEVSGSHDPKQVIQRVWQYDFTRRRYGRAAPPNPDRPIQQSKHHLWVNFGRDGKLHSAGMLQGGVLTWHVERQFPASR
jgi:hypothetical protein